MRRIRICLFGLLRSLFVHVHAADARTDIGAGILNGGVAEVHLRGNVQASFSSNLLIGWTELGGWRFEGEIKPSLSEKAVAGAGAAKVLSVEGYLGVEGSLTFAYPEEPIFCKAELALSGGIWLVTLFYTYSEPLWQYTWSWLEEQGPLSLSAARTKELFSDLQNLDW
jgi:hypothetical protein